LGRPGRPFNRQGRKKSESNVIARRHSRQATHDRDAQHYIKPLGHTRVIPGRSSSSFSLFRRYQRPCRHQPFGQNNPPCRQKPPC
jgi:hypothetical protein